MKTINIENLINGVATFNADPYSIENEEMAEEIMAEVNNNGANIITDEEDRADALAKLDLPEDSRRVIYQAGGCLFSMDDDETPNTLKIDEVINTIITEGVGVMSIVLTDASRYAANAEGPMTWAGTLFTKKYANSRPGDEVITTGNKETNLSEIKRVLLSLVGKGEVEVRLLNAQRLNGEIVE